MQKSRENSKRTSNMQFLTIIIEYHMNKRESAWHVDSYERNDAKMLPISQIVSFLSHLHASELTENVNVTNEWCTLWMPT